MLCEPSPRRHKWRSGISAGADSTEKGIIVRAAEIERRQIELRPVIQGHFYDCAVQR